MTFASVVETGLLPPTLLPAVLLEDGDCVVVVLGASVVVLLTASSFTSTGSVDVSVEVGASVGFSVVETLISATVLINLLLACLIRLKDTLSSSLAAAVTCNSSGIGVSLRSSSSLMLGAWLVTVSVVEVTSVLLDEALSCTRFLVPGRLPPTLLFPFNVGTVIASVVVVVIPESS